MSDATSERDVLDELASLPTFHHPTVSPDGDEVAVYYDGSGRNELHLIDVETGERRQVSDGEVPRNARWHVEWSADGDRVYFHMDEAGNEQNDVHAIDRDGSAEVVVDLDGQVSLSDVGEDGETLLVGSTAGGQMNLYVHDLPSGETTKVTDYDRAVWGGVLSPDAERMAYTTNESDDYDNMDVYVANVDGSEPRNLHIGETGAEAGVADWADERLLVLDNSEDLERCGVYDLESDSVEWFGDGAAEEHPVAFLLDGERFLATRTEDATTMPVVYDVETGDRHDLDLPEGVANFGGLQGGDPVVDDHRVIVTHTTPNTREELVVYDLATDEYETLLEPEYGSFGPGDFADAEFFTFGSRGVAEMPPATPLEEPAGDAELDVEALLYDPRGASRPEGDDEVPAVVKPHGGPRAQDTRSFDLYTQFLVSQGYAVLEVNYRGSTGRGRSFVEELYDDWGGGEQADIAKGATLLQDRDWVDADRVAVFGGSYGGFSAYWQMVQYPDLYDAGVAWIGVTDLEDMYENTMPHFRSELMVKYLGDPEEHPDLYRERSPVAHVENLDAPLLCIHGVNDRRVPVSQARIFREALEDAGYEEGEDGDYEYVELGEEGHASSDIEQKKRAFRTFADFLERRL